MLPSYHSIQYVRNYHYKVPYLSLCLFSMYETSLQSTDIIHRQLSLESTNSRVSTNVTQVVIILCTIHNTLMNLRGNSIGTDGRRRRRRRHTLNLFRVQNCHIFLVLERTAKKHSISNRGIHSTALATYHSQFSPFCCSGTHLLAQQSQSFLSNLNDVYLHNY